MPSISQPGKVPVSNSFAIPMLLCVLVPLLCRPALAQSILEHIARQSTFVFEGTVITRQAATMPIVPMSERTIIVNVERVYQAPEGLADFTGQDVTVLVNDPSGLEVGEHALFYAQGWLLGEGIAVQTVWRFKKGMPMNLSEYIAAASQSVADQELQQRLANAAAVVVGEVAKIESKAEPGQPRQITEHDPQWQEAMIEVEAVLKGDASLKTITVLFPGSLDAAWRSVPKFDIGQEGIWILQEDQNLKAYMALDPVDFQPKNQLDRARGLVERSTKTP
jgi:hypothetical protein